MSAENFISIEDLPVIPAIIESIEIVENPSSETYPKLLDLNEIYQNDIQQAQYTLEQTLSAAEEFRMMIEAALSAVPYHPYEQLKYLYLDKNIKCPTLEELEVPEDFCPLAAISELTAIGDKFDQITYTNLECLTCSDIDPTHACNVFASLSGNSFIVDANQMAKHLIFQETLLSIPVQEMERNPTEVAKKLINFYIKTYK